MLKAKWLVVLGGLFVSTACLSADDLAIDNNSTQAPQADACNEQQYEGKSFDGRILLDLDNEPTKQILSSLESLGETLNSLSILMFAGDKT
ncbi:hypothetical protein AB0559_001301 [Vibrio parahaemolyticus]|uniref:hypothetical protein n=1 Tax=Vibrio parahaemolyticus TaxID=670 RepID=UPI0015DE51A8|nr:hypothetical protein [Vibrio parahaemolyticus]EJG0877033.1 hypothetical protein [Vibrio parahaemolyticus]MBE4185376.1 hypothetical protein [Vibrio parahaemolyticus]MDF4603122.1 hypothetical protein [Vibrio parahaemolyticus]MDF4631278.1 hypothetical protein [Vibrio parahaemolyticus]HBN6280117.1 hypothetical protein [Vibrio parahaemolyticus]